MAEAVNFFRLNFRTIKYAHRANITKSV